MGYHWAFVLLTGAWLHDLVSCKTKNLCDISSMTNKGIIESEGENNDVYDLTSDGCSSDPNALVLKFALRNKDCSDKGNCEASSTITVGEVIFNTCDDGMKFITCYVILTTEFPLSSVPDPECTLLYRVATMPKVTFKYEMCKDSSKLNLAYEHIVKKAEPTTTRTEKVENFSTVTTKSEATESTSDSYTTDTAEPDVAITTEPYVTTTTEPYVTTSTEPYVTTSNEPYVTTTKSEGNQCATSMPSQPLPQRDSSATVAAIILGILLILALLALGIMAIKYHRVMTSQKLDIDSRGVGEGTNSGEVIVNEVYNSFGDDNPGGEVVVNELYGHKQ